MGKRERGQLFFAGMVLLLTLVGGMLAFYSVSLYERDRDLFTRSQNELFVNSQSSLLYVYEEFSNFVYHAIVGQEGITSRMSQAAVADGDQLAGIRERLYQDLLETYEISTRHGFRQLHFHLPNGDSFLRFHSPDKYGDNLLDVRPSIRIANEEKRYVRGFEEGRIFNGYRFVYPLFHEGVHVGSVEVSISVAGYLEAFRQTYPGRDVGFLLRRDVVEETVFAEEKARRYIPSHLSDAFYMDRDVYSMLAWQRGEIQAYRDDAFLAVLRARSEGPLSGGESFQLVLPYQGTWYLAQYETLRNLEEEPVGYLYSISREEYYGSRRLATGFELASIGTVYGLLLLILGNARRTQRRIYALAMTDPLTKVYNRHSFFEYAHRESARSKRSGRPLSFAIMDLDHFKKVNDEHGHAEGDQVLRTFASRAAGAIRESDVLGRYGGEEFVLMLPETDTGQAMQVAERIRCVTAEHPFGAAGTITVSIGVAEKAPDEGVERTIERADRALYRAKEDGRDRICADPEQPG